jgi:hypothetical protein
MMRCFYPLEPSHFHSRAGTSRDAPFFQETTMKKLCALALVVVPALAFAAAPLKLPTLGISINLPADSKIETALGVTMVKGGGTDLTLKVIQPKSAGDVHTAAEAEKIIKEMSFLKMLKSETTPDLWYFFYTKGTADFSAWAVLAQRTVDKKVVQCQYEGYSKEEGEKAVAACKSIAKL